MASRTLSESRRAVLGLYRKSLRQSPKICKNYMLDIPLEEVRSRIKFLFQENTQLKDPSLVDILVHKGHHDLDEAIENWATRYHVLHFFQEIEDKKQAKLLQNTTNEEEEFLSSMMEPEKGSLDDWRKFV